MIYSPVSGNSVLKSVSYFLVPSKLSFVKWVSLETFVSKVALDSESALLGSCNRRGLNKF